MNILYNYIVSIAFISFIYNYLSTRIEILGGKQALTPARIPPDGQGISDYSYIITHKFLQYSENWVIQDSIFWIKYKIIVKNLTNICNRIILDK